MDWFLYDKDLYHERVQHRNTSVFSFMTLLKTLHIIIKGFRKATTIWAK